MRPLVGRDKAAPGHPLDLDPALERDGGSARRIVRAALRWEVGNTPSLVDHASLFAAPATAGRLVVIGEGGRWYTLSLDFGRIPRSGPDGFTVTATLRYGGLPAPGRSLQIDVPRGLADRFVDHGDGTYSFEVSPAGTGIHPVTVTVEDAKITRDVLVLPTVAEGVGQAVAVPGMVNTDGYEDGVSITPDGEYLFI